MLNKLTIRVKLFISFFVLIILTIVIGGIGYLRINNIATSGYQAYQNTTIPLDYCIDFAEGFQRMRVNTRDALIAENPEDVKKFIDRFYELSSTFDSVVKLYEGTIFDETDKANLAAVVACKANYIKEFSLTESLLIANTDDMANAAFRGDMLKANVAFQDALDKIADYNAAGAKITADANLADAKSSSTFLMILLGISLLVAIILAIVISSNIQKIIQSVILETKRLADAAKAGLLKTRSDVNKINFEFREIVVGINETLDAVITPLNVAADYVDKIAKGDIPEKISDSYNGDFNLIKNNLNQCIDAINELVTDAKMLSEAAIAGRLLTRADASKHHGDYKEIVAGVNQTLDTLVGLIDNMPAPAMLINKDFEIQYMNRIGAVLNNTTGENLVKSKAKCYDHFKTTDCKTERCACARAMRNSSDVNSEAQANPTGNKVYDISYVGVPVKDMQGSIVGAFEIVTDQTQIKQAARVAEKIANYQSVEVSKLTESLEKMSVGDIDINLKTNQADEDTNIVKEKFDVISNAVNKNISVQKEIVEKAKLVAKGDLTIELTPRSSADDLIMSLRDMVKAVGDVVVQVQSAADNIADASQEMSANAQQVSQGATEQASSAEEVSSSMEEMSSNIQQNTENAQQTEKISIGAAGGMEKVSTASQESLKSIKEIANKISIIGDIAFQTNILALNAAVEAARAGEHGRGFAVVAAEVRKLAERSKVAAEEINVLSQSSVDVTQGSEKMVSQIIPDIEKTARLLQEITAASLEQSSGASQINNAIAQLNQVTQQNAAAAEEMATSSEELSSQADHLRELISFFKVDNTATKNIRSNTSKKQHFAAAQPQKIQQHQPKVHFDMHHSENGKKGTDISLSAGHDDKMQFDNF